jgi:arginine exporter protein ArgO
MRAVLVAGALAGYGVAMPVGMVGAYLATLASRTSLRVGLCASLGVATADGCYALAAMLGGAALAGVIAPVERPLRWISVLVLAAVAIRLVAGAVRAYRRRENAVLAASAPTGAARAYASLLGMTLVNPATVVYFSALVVGGQAASTMPFADRAGFVIAAFAASASWQALIAGGGALVGRLLSGPCGRLVTALVSSAVILLLAGHLATSG